MAEQIAERLRWAVELLAVDPSDRLLEIGCGHGAAVSIICGSLVDGTITAIDRSEKMIRIAADRNASHIAAKKASFLIASLDEADLGQSRFTKIFAVNVNLFWMRAARELNIVKERLLPGGAVYLFNQPPAAGQIAKIAESTARNLTDAGFVVVSIVVADHLQAPGVCVIATRPPLEHADSGRPEQ